MRPNPYSEECITKCRGFLAEQNLFSMWNVVSVRIGFSMEMFGMPALILLLLKPHQDFALWGSQAKPSLPPGEVVKLFSSFLWENPWQDFKPTEIFLFLPHLHSRGATRAGFLFNLLKHLECHFTPPPFPPVFVMVWLLSSEIMTKPDKCVETS